MPSLRSSYGKVMSLISDIEHPAIKESAAWLKTQGFEVDYAPVMRVARQSGCLLLVFSVQIDLGLVMAVNNEILPIQPIHEIAALLEDRPTIGFHVDAVQALAKVATEVYLPELDFATFSSHNSMASWELVLSTSRRQKILHPLNGWVKKKKCARQRERGRYRTNAKFLPTLSYGKLGKKLASKTSRRSARIGQLLRCHNLSW